MSSLTRQERQTIVAMALEGKSVKEIRKATGRSREAIIPELTRAGLDGDGIEKAAWSIAERKYYEDARKKARGEYIPYRAFRDNLSYAEQAELVLAAKKEYIDGCKAYRKLLMDDYIAENTDINSESIMLGEELRERVQELEEENRMLKELLRKYLNQETDQSNTPDDRQQAKAVSDKTPIQALPLSARTINCLARANIITIGDVKQYTYETLPRIRNFGKASREELVKVLKEYDIDLG